MQSTDTDPITPPPTLYTPPHTNTLRYPAARRFKRSIVCHVGPTNSGKTYEALERLRGAQNGVYCGPLRLLAWEVHEKLNAAGVVSLSYIFI